MAGYRIAYVLEIFPEIALLDTQEPMHEKGGVLDVTFPTATMVKRIRWCGDKTFTNDHFGIVTTILDAQRPQHNPRLASLSECFGLS